MLIEAIQKRFAFAHLATAAAPISRCANRRLNRAADRAQSWAVCLAGGIRAQQTVSEGCRSGASCCRCTPRCARRRKTRAFVRVVADQYRRVVELFSVVNLVLIVGQSRSRRQSAMPCHACPRVAAMIFSGGRLRSSAMFAAPAFCGERDATAFRVSECAHVFAGLPCSTIVSERTAAL